MESFSRDGLTFEVTETGPSGGRVVIALHGFPEDRHCWDTVAGTLAASGYRVLAPDQRGYSPAARPSGRRAYRIEELTADVLALANSAGAERFDVIGHDWGAVVAWHLAGRHADRVRSLTALSVPHPRAFLASMATSSQLAHSWYMIAFQVPRAAERLLQMRAGAFFRDRLVASGLDQDSAERYATRARAGEMTGPINWYRALPLDARAPLGPVTVPTLYLWGSGDRFVTRAAAERCGRFVTGPFVYGEVQDGSHWLPSGSPDEVAHHITAHLAHP